MTTTRVDAPEPDPGVARVVRMIAIVAVALFWLIATSWRPWELFERGGFSADFYDEQARVLLRGRLAVDPAVASFEGFVVDGRTYLYYGPLLAVVRMPLMLFGDVFVGRLVRVSMLIALVVLIHWSARLARVAERVVRSAGEQPTGKWGTGVFVASVAFSPALFAAGWTSVYHETELWALAFAVITITLIVEWAADGFDGRRQLLWAGVAALATTLTRAPIGFGVAAALGLCGLWLLSRGERHRAAGWSALVAGSAALVVHMLVNVAKFGSLLSVPADKQQLSLIDPGRAAWFAGNDGSFFSPRFLPTTLAQYLRPDTIRFERLIPGVRFGPLAPDYGSYPVETVTPSSSLIVSATLLVVLAVVGIVWLVRARARLWLAVVGATVLGAVPTLMIGFIANRYLIDLLPPLIAAGAIGAAALPPLDGRRAVRVGAVVLVTWGAWVNASLATWTLELKSPGFTELRYAVDDALFGGGHPSLITVEPQAPVPRDGVVGVLADCTAVYIAEQGRWVALDRAEGVRSVSGMLAEGAQVLAMGTNWTVAVDGSAADAVLVFTEDDGAGDFSRPLTSAVGTSYEVVVDEVMLVSVVTVGDDVVVLPFDVVRFGGADIRPVKTAAPPTSPLCRSLTD